MKRLTETAKWQDAWFRRLEPAQKLAYLYVLDSCDNKGVFDPDEDLASFVIGARVNLTALAGQLGPRLEILPNGKWKLTRFESFQTEQVEAPPAKRRVLPLLFEDADPVQVSLDSLRSNPAYAHINIDAEQQKLRVWCAAHKKQPTLKRFIAWLNRIEAPIGTQAAKPALPSIPEPQGWRFYIARNYPDCVFLDESNERFARTWADLPRDMQQKFAAEMKYASSAA